MNDFRRDNDWQMRVRDAVLAPGFYGKHAIEGRYVFVDKGRLATTLQRDYAVDTILQGSDGAIVCVEEKIVRWPGYVYSAYALETDSCTVPGREKRGWMHYAQADYLLYAFMQPDRLLVHLIDFPKLREWFWPNVESFDVFGPLDTLNRTKGRKVPIAQVKANAPTWERDIRPDLSEPEVAELFQGTRSAA